MNHVPETACQGVCPTGRRCASIAEPKSTCYKPFVMSLKVSSEVDKPSASVAEAAQMAIEAGLIYVSDAEPGIRRLRVGRGFRYVTPENQRLAAEKHLKRIASLAIPPAYRDVWISLQERGHLQATGRDARGRKQYRYHPDWRVARDADKFERMLEFGAALPRIRARVKAQLSAPLGATPQRETVLATMKLVTTQERCCRLPNSPVMRGSAVATIF